MKPNKNVPKHLHIIVTSDEHKALRRYSFKSNRSIGDIIRELVDIYILGYEK